ncbi:MAG TPA: hypothetical protein VGU68_10745 [Ktedonobacteraceae bacterium]|nr:hypothetical protein [Ktedonobacteraceae bacterium]
MRRPYKKGVEPVDEHNQPTEPIDFAVAPVSPYAPTVTSDSPATLPVPNRPFSPPMPPQAPLIGAYPYLPPTPTRQGGYDGYAGNAPMQPGSSASTNTKRRRVFPVLVGLCFVAIQLILLARFVLTIVTQWNDIAWVSIFYSVSALLIWPVQALLQQFSMPLAASVEISTLLAILAYGLLSRILVRCLKLILRSR